MKKLYAFLAAALIGTAAMPARELVFYLEDTPIKDGETVEFRDFETFPGKDGGTQVEMYPMLYLYSDILTKKVKITANCTSGQVVGLCAGGNCVKDTKIVKEGIKINGKQKLELNFDYDATIPAGQAVPEVVTEFEAVDVDHPNTLKKFTFIMNPKAGVSTIISSDNNFYAVQGAIKYNFDAPVSVALYSITGKKVLATTLSGEGTISTDGLDRGIYVYTAGNRSGKLYIR